MSSALYILSYLGETDTEWLMNTGTYETIPAGTILIHEGHPVKNLHIILDGEVAVTVSDASGKKEVARRGRGQVVGEMSFVDARPPSATVHAAQESRVFTIPRHKLVAKLSLDIGRRPDRGGSHHRERPPRRVPRGPGAGERFGARADPPGARRR